MMFVLDTNVLSELMNPRGALAVVAWTNTRDLRETEMIIREWRGRAAKSNANAYPNHFRATVVPELRQVPGFLGAYLSQRSIEDKIEFLVLTRWASMDAIHGFAGSDVDGAVVEPAAVAALVDFDNRVQHYVVIENV